MRYAPGAWTLALLLAAGPARGAVTHSLLPWKAQAGKAFDLMLAGPYACNTAFSDQAVSVGPGRIALYFLSKEIQNIRCGPPSQPLGPEFSIPALGAGEHPVYAQDLASCDSAAGCDPGTEPALVGTLKVTAEAAYGPGWFLHPGRVASGKDVRVALLNRDRGSCENGFQTALDTVRSQTADLSFHTLYFRRMCKTSVHPFGPEFNLGDLAPGAYRVEGYDLPECSFQDPPCIPIVARTPVLVDTLVVGASSGVRAPPGRAAPPSPRLRRLPRGPMAWQGAGGKAHGLEGGVVVTPDGRRVRPVLRVLPLEP